jgi:hypothetical protein
VGSFLGSLYETSTPRTRESAAQRRLLATVVPPDITGEKEDGEQEEVFTRA